MIVLNLILLTLFFLGSHGRLPDKVYCANEKCDEPISKAVSILPYSSPDPNRISFRGKNEAIVYMKSADSNSELWYATIGGKTGFVPSRFLKEIRVIYKKPLVTVSYEENENVQPDKVQQAHEIVEGTTIYTSETTMQQDAASETVVNTMQQDAASETMVNTMQQDATQPVTSFNEDNTYQAGGNNLSESVDNISQNNISQLSGLKQDSSENKMPNENLVVDTSTKLTTSEIDDKELIETTTISTESFPEASQVDKSQSEPVNDELVKKAIPGDLPASISTEQPILSESSTENNEPLIEDPENPSTLSSTANNEPLLKVPADTLSKSVLSSNDEESLQLSKVSPKELNNESNGDYPQNYPQENPSSESIVQQDFSLISESDSGSNKVNDVLINKIASTTEEPFSTPSTDVPNVEESPIKESSPDLKTAPVLETIPPTPPILKTFTTDLPPPVTTATIPALYPQEAQTISAPETIEPIVDIEQSAAEPPYKQQDALSDIESTTSTPYYMEEKTDQHIDPEPISKQDLSSEENTYNSPNEQTLDEIISTTETSIQDDKTEGFLSNIYSSVADMWPSTTEAPPPIYNTEDYPTYNSEKDGGSEGFSFTKYILSTYYSLMGTNEETKALFASVGETCYTDEYCDGTSNDGTNRLLTFLLTTASSVLLFTLGYYYIDNRRQDGRLIGQINSLQRDLLFTTKECEILKEQLSSTKNKLAGIEDSSFGMDDMVQSLKEEINELKATNDRLRNSLDDNEKLLRVSENTAGELQNTLSEVENTLSELLAERANSEEHIIELNGKIQAFEEELISVSRDRDNFQLKYVSADSALEELKKYKKQFEDVTQQLSESKNIIELQKHEINALKDAIKEVKSGMSSNVDVTSLIDHTEIKAKLSKALEEKKSFESRYESEHKECVRLSEELQTTKETLHTTSQNATEALTRLDVLGKYFQERESELLKELNAKEALWLSKQGESTSTVEKMELLQQEIQRYKEKCDALTLELAEQESSRRAALSEVEARAHAAWLEARAARRDADAARDDAAALRRKLAHAHAHAHAAPADGALSPHHKVASPLDSMENPVIPPPLPPMFLPPPLLPPLPRPPPLGRLPSPLPTRYGDRRYSPESRYSPGSRYSPESRYSPDTVRYSPDIRYSPRTRRSPYSPRSRRRSRSRERYEQGRGSRSRNGPADTETEYNSDSPSREPRRRSRYSRHSGPSSGSGCSSESDK